MGMDMAERRRSMDAEDAEWVEAEAEQHKLMVGEALADATTPAAPSLTQQRRTSVDIAERRRSMDAEDAEWVEAEAEQHKLLVGDTTVQKGPSVNQQRRSSL